MSDNSKTCLIEITQFLRALQTYLVSLEKSDEFELRTKTMKIADLSTEIGDLLVEDGCSSLFLSNIDKWTKFLEKKEVITNFINTNYI